jgi:hypothetical protein
MTKYILLMISMAGLLMPYVAVADNRDEVTISVLQMDEETPDSVINRIALPVIEDELSSVVRLRAPEENGLTNLDERHGMDFDTKGLEPVVEVEDLQREIPGQGHGK